MKDRKIKIMPIDEVIEYENNPRKNDDAVEYVANSIREFGFQSPIIVDENNVIICGHTRKKAAQRLGLTEVPVVVADNLTDEQVKAYRLADNKTGELSTWDWEQLNAELEDIDWLDLNMEQFGFSAGVDIDQFFEDAPENGEGGSNEPSEPKEVQCPHCKMYFTVQ